MYVAILAGGFEKDNAIGAMNFNRDTLYDMINVKSNLEWLNLSMLAHFNVILLQIFREKSREQEKSLLPSGYIFLRAQSQQAD